MFENITKKQFIETLSKGNNILLYSNMNMLEKGFTKIMNALYDLEEVKSEYYEVRKCVKKQSNAIKFSNGSWLYFNEVHSCYKHNNIIITINERYDTFDEVYKYDIMAYAIV